MQEATRNTELLSLAEQMLKDADARGADTVDILANSSATISGTVEKYILNEHLISKACDAINQYERKANFEKMIIVALLVVYFAIALNIVKERLLW